MPAQLASWLHGSSLQRVADDGFAEELGDGRGITFGRAGFTTGTGDGLVVVQRYADLKPENNTLAEYLPALRHIVRQLRALEASSSHDFNGTIDDLEGLDGFAEAVRELGGDPEFQAVQDMTLQALYFQPSQRAARALGLKYALSKAQLYDAWVQHGAADAEGSHRKFRKAANGIVAWVNEELGGTPLTGVNETLWLETYLARRKWVLDNADETWQDSTPRVDLYRWLLELKARGLDKPIRLSWAKCQLTEGVHHRGPCTNQTSAAYAVGGVDYGDFYIP
ncbi:hypothetical protein CHLNCDRAFT_53480 [Chlorella variabilis]|uniref:Chitosanase n=1 Tax=Chlorella variabilis TaxID=554065 RepID=E1ZJA2_CHLVA|nr:hypothetical protein CHLNCDRAFT_53480 [Chlorella variabilis]EFN53959.1 hypothetical protein CHLNCDRAFT_53480 [Chlorella variabilis]|eukprot:XP_005846061.1 hypothetical protein CHLNCDRAFT_53480 [Chlorella variabilis]